MMMQHRIKLRPDEVREFVTAASKCLFDVDISYNSFIVDAKSILGVMALDLTGPVRLRCHSDDTEIACNGYDNEFEQYLQKFAVAC